MKWLTAGGLAALAGCTGDGGGGTATPTSGDGDGGGDGGGDGTMTPGDEETATPTGGVQTGGTLRLAGITPPQSLSPLKGTGQGDFVFFEWMYDRLTRYNRDFELVPHLATEWEANEDATVWTFKLREGVTFNNIDQEVLAEDVKATAEVMASEDRVPGAAADLGPLDRIEVTGDYRFKAHLKKASNVYPNRLGETGSWFNIVPKNVIENRFDELTSTDFGSGPFNLTSFESDSQYTFEANDDWFLANEEGTAYPYVDTLRLSNIPDLVAQVNALTGERVDALHKVDTNVLQRVERADGAAAKGYTTSSFLSMVMLTSLETEGGDKPFADVRVRKALKHALDREAIKTATDGTMTIGHHDPVAPVHPNYAPFDPGLEFGTTAQPEKAKQLLEEAGYGDGLTLPTPIYSTDFDPRRGTAVQLLQQQARQAGIEFEIKKVTADTWLSDYWNQAKTWYASGYAARMEETTVHRLALHDEGKWNSGRWTGNEEYNKAYDVFSTTTDQEKYVNAFQKAQRIMHLNGPWLVFGFTNQYAANNDYMGNYVPGPAANRNFEHDAWLTGDAPEGP